MAAKESVRADVREALHVTRRMSVVASPADGWRRRLRPRHRAHGAGKSRSPCPSASGLRKQRDGRSACQPAQAQSRRLLFANGRPFGVEAPYPTTMEPAPSARERCRPTYDARWSRRCHRRRGEGGCCPPFSRGALLCSQARLPHCSRVLAGEDGYRTLANDEFRPSPAACACAWRSSEATPD